MDYQIEFGILAFAVLALVIVLLLRREEQRAISYEGKLADTAERRRDLIRLEREARWRE